MAGSPPNNQTEEELDAMIAQRSATMPTKGRKRKADVVREKKPRKGHKASPKSQVKL